MKCSVSASASEFEREQNSRWDRDSVDLGLGPDLKHLVLDFRIIIWRQQAVYLSVLPTTKNRLTTAQMPDAFGLGNQRYHDDGKGGIMHR